MHNDISAPPKRFAVFIGKILVLHFTLEEDAREFAAGFNFARRQRDKLLYEFKNRYRTRGFRYALQVRDWLERLEELDKWFSTRANLTPKKSTATLPKDPSCSPEHPGPTACEENLTLSPP